MSWRAEQVGEEYNSYKRITVLEQIGREVFGDQFVGQESSVTPDALIRLARNAGLNNASRVLDAGCGKGKLTLALAEDLSCELVGIDVSTSAIEHALSDAGTSPLGTRCTFQVGRLEDTAFPDSSFDAVLSVGSLYWASENLSQVFSEWRRILRNPGGAALVMITRSLRPLRAAELDALEVDYFTPMSEIENSMIQSGFRVHARANTTAFAAWLEAWSAALRRHGDELSQQMGPDAAERFIRKFSTLQELCLEGCLERCELVGLLP